MDILVDNFGVFTTGMLGTAKICLYGGIGSLLLGALLAVFRVSPIPVLQGIAKSWVTVFRNCPLTVVLFLVAFGLPEVGFRSSYLAFGVTALILYTAAFISEALRSGVNSVGDGQAEAARAIGMSFLGSLSIVILPQAIRSSIPSLTNYLVAMIKNSAIVGAFGVGGELFSVADTLTATRGISALPVLSGIVVGYLIIILPFEGIMSALERKLVFAR